MIGKFSKRILLTGAGWSRNWGGQLANEVWSSLVGHPRIRANAGLRDLLLDETAFKIALGKTHVAPFTAADRTEIEKAVLDTFVAMDREIARPDHDPWINIYKVQELLFRFFGQRNEGNSSGYLFTLIKTFSSNGISTTSMSQVRPAESCRVLFQALASAGSAQISVLMIPHSRCSQSSTREHRVGSPTR